MHRKTRSHQDKPDPIPRLREEPKILHIKACASMLLEDADVYAGAQEYPLFTMSSLLPAPWRGSDRYRMNRSGIDCSFAWMARGSDDQARGRWWSQTGSNRRPQACKASALPTELWPLKARHIAEARSEINPLSATMSPSQREWWAWEDLNFRPHAYQARALTN